MDKIKKIILEELNNGIEPDKFDFEDEYITDFDTTNLYKFLSDGLYRMRDMGFEQQAAIIERELLKSFNISRK